MRVFTIEKVRNRSSGLIVAMSDDLPGLYVHGRSDEEVEERVVVAMRDILEAQGETGFEIERVEQAVLPSSFVPTSVRYRTLEALAA